jgi:hypothetical protein
MRRALTPTLLCIAALAAAPPALAGAHGSGAPPSLRDRVQNLQQELDSLTEDVQDLQEPVNEFELFDQCMYLIGVTQYGSTSGTSGFLFGAGGTRRPALALDVRGFGRPRDEFLAFPAEEPPSIECNEDAGQEQVDN